MKAPHACSREAREGQRREEGREEEGGRPAGAETTTAFQPWPPQLCEQTSSVASCSVLMISKQLPSVLPCDVSRGKHGPSLEQQQFR